MTPEEQTKLIFDPILEVMTCADGGVAFARLYHSFVPEMIAKAGDPKVDEFIVMLNQFSRMCKYMLES